MDLTTTPPPPPPPPLDSRDTTMTRVPANSNVLFSSLSRELEGDGPGLKQPTLE